jgi:3-phenylpropionate/trans-cinnamate dioxygenase ferredoxin subunit
MKKYIVARMSEIPEGGRLIVEVRGKSIGIFNVGGTLRALLNRCPHQGAELCRGAVVAKLSSGGPGQFEFDLETRYLACPWHGWEFDLATGQSYFDARGTRVRSYEVERVPGPYVADTVDVAVEDDYVVVTL